MESSSSSFTKGKPYQDAKDHIANGEYNKAMEILEDLARVHWEDQDAWLLRLKQGEIFLRLAKQTEEPNVELTYFLGTLECYSLDDRLFSLCAKSLHKLARMLGSVSYYKKCLKKAKLALSLTLPDDYGLLSVIKDAESKIASPEALVGSIMETKPEPKLLESKKSSAPHPREDLVKRLRTFWLGLDVKVKRDFMKVSIGKLKSFVLGQVLVESSREGGVTLEQVLASARKDMIWTFWVCCSNHFSSAEDCKNHLEQEHAADFVPKDRVQRIGKDWTRKISVGGWEPVDALAAVEMIKNELAYVKSFAAKCKNGWSEEWPLAEDEERRKLLKEIKLILVSLSDRKTFSCSVRDWLMRFPVKHLENFEISKQSLVDSRLLETPQSICFLECHELNHILEFLNNIKRERDDGTYLVSRAVDSVLGRTRVKEKIDFDPQFSYLLLDRRLLKSNNTPLNEDATINVFDPNVHYVKAHVQGDDIVSWLTDNYSLDKTFFRSIREDTIDMWVAVLRAVQFTCRNLGTKYAKKALVFDYEAALTVIQNICMSEDERRKNLQEDQWIRYACLLCDKCEERVPEDSLTSKLLLCAVRDVLEGALHPTFDAPDLEDCLSLIREQNILSDDKVLKSIGLLKSMVTHKVLLIDAKILLIDNSRKSLLNNLVRLCVYDNRTYIFQLMKPFLLNEILNMEFKAKADAVAVDLLLEEEKKKSQSKKKNDKKNKRTSTSKPCTHDKTVERKPSVNLEPESTSPSVEEDSMEQEDALASERGRLEISSNIQNQEDATQDDPDTNMLGEDSFSAHSGSTLEGSAAICSSAFDMTLKALLNIKVLKVDLMNNMEPFQAQLEPQIPSSLQNVFTALVSEEIKNEGVYSWLLSDLLTSVEEVIYMSSDAAKVVVAILEFWSCWKIPERESMVTRLFTLVGNERMSCRKCRRITNYPEQSSPVLVMAADSIRQLKCALESINFVDILRVICMEYQKSCDIEQGGCGESNFVHHIISRCPPIFTIVLERKKSETEKQISETTKAFDCEMDISRLYVGLEPNTNYRLVSMVGCGEDEEHICVAYENNRWVNLKRESLAGEDVGDWNDVISFFGERKVQPEILFYEAVQSKA
ncbi:PREDICTED: uncharacterized protein LOC104778166 [Camelina sativa]|uniref:Uncharacterized protein LOC104778166 n=1 Tax=Camelina sativa TaxID=90675 RepID=A0ABM0YH87_CAMSA|nr:PREDICTED: uncharacterized protein LOC104778166 [Camelina sativa]